MSLQRSSFLGTYTCPLYRMIPSSRFHSSRPQTMDLGPFFKMASRATLTSVSYSWEDLILWHRVVSPRTVTAGGQTARTVKNLVSRSTHSLLSGAIPPLWSGCQDR